MKRLRASSAIATLSFGLISIAWGSEPRTSGEPVPCAVIDRSGGAVQILDSTRTKVLASSPKAGVPCGGWVTIEEGWIEMKHRDGYRIHGSSRTFFRVSEDPKDHAGEGDHLILYKGDVYARIDGKQGDEFRILTANARVRVTKGGAIAIFSKENEESQVIALDESASLENRFQPERKITVRGGEATGLDFKLLRVVPSTPRAVSLAALRTKLSELHVEDREAQEAVDIALARTERHFPQNLKPEGAPHTATATASGHEADGPGHGGRAVASVEGGAKHAVDHPKVPHSDYRRHAPGDEAAQAKWTRKLVGGVESGEKVLFPEKFVGRAQKVVVKVSEFDEAAAEKAALKKKREDDQEKRRLIQELSQIRED